MLVDSGFKQMFDSEDMEASVTLASLPDDIKIVITRMIHRYEDLINARLISPAWNTVVRNHLASTIRPISIERVYLHSGNVAVEDYKHHGARHNNDSSKRVRMHAIIPDEHIERVGVGKWLCVHEEFRSALELFCAPQKFRAWSAPSAFVALLQRKKKEKRRFRLFERLFSGCAQIDTLVLDHMKDKYLTVFDALISKLGEISIANLEIKEFEVDENMQERILNMVRKHRIQHLAIACCKLEEHSLAEFLMTLVKMEIKFDFYEESFNRQFSGRYRLPLKFWTKLNSYMVNHGVSLVYTSEVIDPGFNNNVMNSEVISRMSCVRGNGHAGAQFQHTTSRGFFRKLAYL